MKRLWLLIPLFFVISCGAAQTELPTSTAVTVSTEVQVAGVEATQAVASPETTQPVQATKPALAHADLLNTVLFSQAEGTDALKRIMLSGDTRFVAGLIDALRYQRGFQQEITGALNTLTGQNLPPDWFAWQEWAGQQEQIESFEGYPGWKAGLFAQIDPNFLRFVYEDIEIDPNSRVEEIVWGGVRVDGIPALDNPTMINPALAGYLEPQERVFGVSINGDTRAYPARFLDWHEMFNDVVGGEPVSLAY